ncbi:vacuolar protein sorting 18-like protein [Reticulomyxa filosa]|uniref:Vacuolar protein sorting 18-like protein n=1 Tax=Reticulomyxa filosa TaxID=46433 RepID=X6N328_RETFI|nr:vacuolar protein sorting 18-like protein [Reticulomyxa filosa]|eukprot:ETO20293.1 vacuolar protein sorting 18-like protein [Reticulomyxa filosa]
MEEEDDDVLPTLEDDEEVNVEDDSLFEKNLLQWAPDRKDGAIVAMALGNNTILVATDKHKLFMLTNDGNTAKGRSPKKDVLYEESCTKYAHAKKKKEFEIPKKFIGSEKNQIHKIFMDWNCNHILVTYESDANVYINVQKAAKPMQLTKCKGLVIESVVWDEHGLTKTNTGVIVFGTTDGGIYEMIIGEKEKHFAKLYDLTTCRVPNANEPNKIFHESKTSVRVCGLHIEYLASKDEGSGPLSRASVASRAQNVGLGAGRNSEMLQQRVAMLGNTGFIDNDSDEDEPSVKRSGAATGTSTVVSSAPERKQSMSSAKETGAKLQFYVVAIIPNRMYEFIGGPTLHALFRAYDNKPEFKEIPGSFILNTFCYVCVCV